MLALKAFVMLSVMVYAESAPMYNQTFSPWTVMGPVNTKGSGSAMLNYTGEGYDYEVFLYKVYGLKSIELHVAAPGTHGTVVAVFYAAAFQDPSQVTNGLAAKGTIKGHDFLGPLLLPLGQHLPASILEDRYVSTGNAVVVVHTLANEGGELGAQLPASKVMDVVTGMPMPMGATMAPAAATADADSMAGMHMHMDPMGSSASGAAPAPATVMSASVDTSHTQHG